MNELGTHTRIRLDSDRLLHSSAAQRRSLARSVHKIARPWPYLAFGCAGTHLHLSVKSDHREAGELARRLEISLQRRQDYGTPFLKVHRLPFRDQRHVFSSVLYDMRQREHHDLAADPFLEATSAPDLLGARLLGAHLIPRVGELVPELRRRHLLALYGIDDLREAEVWDQPADVIEAALAAFALADLRGSTIDVRNARQVVVYLLGAELSAREVASLVHCSLRTVERLRAVAPPHPAHLRAVRLQLDLRARVNPGVDRGVVV